MSDYYTECDALLQARENKGKIIAYEMITGDSGYIVTEVNASIARGFEPLGAPQFIKIDVSVTDPNKAVAKYSQAMVKRA